MKVKKIRFPTWVIWFFISIFIPLLIIMEYEAFYGSNPYPLIGASFGFIFVLIILMVFLVCYERAPQMAIGKQTKVKKDEEND